MNENERHLTQNGADEQSFRKWLDEKHPAFPKTEVSAVGKNVEKTTESAILKRASQREPPHHIRSFSLRRCVKKLPPTMNENERHLTQYV
jgi:hypothetical protein